MVVEHSDRRAEGREVVHDEERRGRQAPRHIAEEGRLSADAPRRKGAGQAEDQDQRPGQRREAEREPRARCSRSAAGQQVGRDRDPELRDRMLRQLLARDRPRAGAERVSDRRDEGRRRSRDPRGRQIDEACRGRREDEREETAEHGAERDIGHRRTRDDEGCQRGRGDDAQAERVRGVCVPVHHDLAR